MKIPEARAARDHNDLAKESINAAIGSLCCRDQTFTYTVRSSGQLDDIPQAGKYLMPTTLGEDQTNFDYITARELLTLGSCRPI